MHRQEDDRVTTVMSEQQTLKTSFTNVEKFLSDLLGATIDKQTKKLNMVIDWDTGTICG